MTTNTVARAVAPAALPVKLEYAPDRAAPRWLVIGAGVLGGLVAAELIVGLAVIL